MTLARAVALLLACVVPATAAAANRYDPRLRFRTMSTPRFDIHFHQGGERLARRLAVVAEEVAARLDKTLGPPAGRVHVILVDQSDLANGWATLLPYNVIELTAAAPRGESLIGNTDDWLRLVFTHEYAHVVHLSRAGGWIGGLRSAFGRMPLLFPNLFQPLWQIEGLATHAESAAGQGRLPAGDFRAILDRAARESRLLGLDRVNGGLLDWPAGHAPYAYGGYFHEYLVRRYGDDTLRRLTDATARRVPYLGAPAFAEVFGRSLGELWKEFEAEVAREAAASPARDAERLTAHGFDVAGPRLASDGTLYYSVVNPHGFPALRALDPGGTSRIVTTRYLGSRIGVAPGLLVFDQLELVRNVGLQSDLYAVATDGGGRRRLTRGARASDPDVASDGQTIVCVVQEAEGRALATMVIPPEGVEGTPTALVSEAFTDFTAPRWSPDGRYIAAERRRPGVTSEIVLVDAVRREVRPVARFPDGRSIAPVWTADGARVIFAADRGGAGFQIFAVDVATNRLWRLEGTGHDARSPDVSADGRRLVYVGYTADGFDLFELPLTDAGWTPVNITHAAAAPAQPAAPVEPWPHADTAYSPWPGVLPRFWTPTLESDADEVVIGAATAGLDVLGRHLYAVEAGWTAARARPDWQIAYGYDRWWPTVFASLSEDTDPFRDGDLRVRELDAGALVARRRVRSSHTWLAAVHLSSDRFRCADCGSAGVLQRSRRALRAGWQFDAARAFGYSLGDEEGWSAGVTTEWEREAFGSDGNAGAAVVDLRGYRAAGPPHAVLAGRAAAATAWGDARTRRRFSAAGSDGPPAAFEVDFDAIGLLRGIDAAEIAGRHAAVVNVDYRVPLWRPERGAGTLPLFVRTLHAAVFADVGHAWDGRFARGDRTRSVGAELSLDVVVGYALPVTLTAGLAHRSGAVDGAVLFTRIGRAF